MPLIHSSSEPAFKANVRTLMGEVGKSPHVKSREQALAIAFATKRRGRAFGGFMPWASKPSASQTMKNEVRAMHKGPVLSAVPGRTDHHPTHVPSGSYVLTADHLSSLGQGNTLAGMKQVNHMFRAGPHGVAAPKIVHGSGPPKPPRLPHAKGGAAHHSVGHPTPVAIAGGEDVLTPDEILGWLERNGFPRDLKLGHAALDAWQTAVRKETVRKLKKLPGPAKS
jgi:hypothetical protein